MKGLFALFKNISVSDEHKNKATIIQNANCYSFNEYMKTMKGMRYSQQSTTSQRTYRYTPNYKLRQVVKQLMEIQVDWVN